MLHYNRAPRTSSTQSRATKKHST